MESKESGIASRAVSEGRVEQADLGSLDDEGSILLTELRSIVPLHPQHIRKLVKRGQFPKPVHIGGRTAFRRRDIRDWARQQG
jgi:predicted DNA-binding transcriptional regulator AlpA